MKPIMNFLILFFCININIFLTTCHPRETRAEYKKLIDNWVENYYQFTGISKKCNWDVTTGFTSNLTLAETIVIKDPLAHILHPDFFFGHNTASPTINYERLECEFNVEAPAGHGLVVSIQQMYFDKKCTDFVQLTNEDGSINETICDTFGEYNPGLYPGSRYLKKINLDEYRQGIWEESDTKGRIHVKISVSKKNFKNLRYLFIAFTAIQKERHFFPLFRDSSRENNDSYSLPRIYYCDGITNWKTAGDEDLCQIVYYYFFAILAFFICWIVYLYLVKGKLEVALHRSTTVEDTPSINSADNTEIGLPTYESLFPERCQQAPSTSRY